MRQVILGLDEVGRGPWAGPLVVGAVILGHEFEKLEEYQEITDSKKLSAKKRERLSLVILEKAAATGLGWVSASEIDRYGLGNSLKLAARRATKEVLRKKVKFDSITIDGTINLLADTPLSNRVALLPKADFLVKEVGAASIIAKVARDRYMAELAAKYPEYLFERHVGYGTAAHKEALVKYGTCPEHRLSFRPVAEIHEKFNSTPHSQAIDYGEVQNKQNSRLNPKNSSTVLGKSAETVVAKHLIRLGHEILAHNFKTKTYEIDLISRCDDKIYFTEVKYRTKLDQGNPLEAITSKKQQQMHYAAEKFLTEFSEFQNLQPLLAAASVVEPDFHVETWFPLETT